MADHPPEDLPQVPEADGAGEAVGGRLGDDDLPLLFTKAEGIAAGGQRQTRRMVRWELWLAVVAAVSGMVSWHVGRWRLDLWAGVGTVAFVVATTLSVVRANRNPEAHWYRGRAAAESVKTLSWLYAVGGNPFPIGDPQADERLRERFDELVDSFDELDDGSDESDDLVDSSDELHHPPPGPDGAREPKWITPAMAGLRGASLRHRRDAYQENRIGNQIDWYRLRIGQHRRSAQRWLVIVVAANAGGAVAGLLRLLAVVQLDLLGLAAAVAGSATAWTQLLQQKNQANAYDLAVDDLEVISRYIDGVPDEQSWARFVDDAEEAISREHTLWLARRGFPAAIDSIRHMRKVEETPRSTPVRLGRRPRPRPHGDGVA